MLDISEKEHIASLADEVVEKYLLRTEPNDYPDYSTVCIYGDMDIHAELKLIKLDMRYMPGNDADAHFTGILKRFSGRRIIS